MSLPAVDQAVQRRNKGYEETHQRLIEAAVRLISERGVDSLSIAAVAREIGINRTTVYYHFDSRDALLDAVRGWSSEQLARGLSQAVPRQERIDFIARFVLDNPELIKLWIDDFISPGDIRDRYPFWDLLVKGIGEGRGEIDAEVYCVMLLTSAIIGPRVFRNSVDPDADTDTIVQRFMGEQVRMLRRDGLAE